ncbi:MAG: RHS repeat-associated core domain-containing protein [Paenibacillaceae bacterium]
MLFESGKIEHIIAAIDNIVNGEINLPPGEKTQLFERIRELGKGYTVIGTKYMYNSRNQLIHRDNQIRYEEYDYTYDEVGNLLTDSRSKYEWDARGHLTKVTFPDGFGEKYTYDMQGRRMTKTQFNHRGDEQHTTVYHYKGDTWVLTEEVHSGDGDDGDDGETTKTYTYDANDRPLSITFQGQTFWYVYNGHGDVMALMDQDGNVVARYEYDAWGLVTRMYNRYGERVREGMGWIGDLGSGNGSPGSLQGPEDSSGNIVPDYHPGNGNKGKVQIQSLSTETDTTVESPTIQTDGITLESVLAEEVDKPTEDITTDLVKENPIRYAGYYWDRKTQYYYLQARYYNPRPARFISEDTYEGEIKNPQSLNMYVYVQNNPLKYTDPSGHEVFLVHGTWSDDSTWTTEFIKYVGELFDEGVQTEGWSGDNNKGARSDAADDIFNKIYKWH